MMEQELMQLRASELDIPTAEACAKRSELSSPIRLTPVHLAATHHLLILVHSVVFLFV